MTPADYEKAQKVRLSATQYAREMTLNRGVKSRFMVEELNLRQQLSWSITLTGAYLSGEATTSINLQTHKSGRIQLCRELTHVGIGVDKDSNLMIAKK